MKLTLRKALFWPHLVAGVTAGLVILTLSITGVVLVFEKPVLRWADEDARTVVVPADGQRMALQTLLARAQASRSDARPSAITVEADPAAAVLVAFGREDGVYVDPYNGEVRPLGAERARAFFHGTTELHRWLLAQGENRAVGKAITGAANLLFFFLALTGLYLWFPRKWAWRAFRPALWFRGGLRGKARDFSWHNVIGFWSVPVLLVLTVSGAVISYRWASDLVYRAAGSEPPAQGRGGAPKAKVPTPPEGATRAGPDAHFAAAARAVPDYASITWRIGSDEEGKTQPVALMVRRDDAPQRATVQLAMDPFTSAVLATEGYENADAGRKVRMWLRFLHTGEALGAFGQVLAALASLGAVFLVYTGLMLAFRRFFPRRRKAEAPAAAPAVEQEPSLS